MIVATRGDVAGTADLSSNIVKSFPSLHKLDGEPLNYPYISEQIPLPMNLVNQMVAAATNGDAIAGESIKHMNLFVAHWIARHNAEWGRGGVVVCPMKLVEKFFVYLHFFRCHSYTLTMVPSREFIRPRPRDGSVKDLCPTDLKYGAVADDLFKCSMLAGFGSGGLVGTKNKGREYVLPRCDGGR